MDVTQQTIIETLFNVAGFLLASGLWMLFYSKTQRREKNSARAQVVEDKSTQVVHETPQATKEKNRNVEFLSLRSNPRQETVASISLSKPIKQTNHSISAQSRVDIIRTAREMLNNGKSYEDIKRKLPITEGELALLSIA